MNEEIFAAEELLFLREPSGELVALQEGGSSWMGVLAFSSEDKAEAFRREAGLLGCEIVGLNLKDRDSLSELVRQLKPRLVRSLFVDLDLQTAECTEVWFVGDGLGEVRKRKLARADVSKRR